MSSQSEAKKKVAELVERYKALTPAQIKKYTEAETCKDFILPLFKALGWDTEDKTEVSAEEHTSKIDRSDYGFYLNGWPKFYLEAKKLDANIDDEKFAKQATSYSWNKGITWAILTDFESLLVFNSQDIAEHLSHKLFFRINFDEYTKKFDKLWWLSREAFVRNVLDEEAEEVGKKLQKISVTEKLYKDLNDCRELLLRSFHVWNKDKPFALLDEGVQKFLDRLIFIRVAEDRELEQPTLVPMLRAAGGSSSEEFFKQLVGKFKELDKIYNSELFAPHPFEDWQEYDGATEKAIDILHGKTGYYDYDFQAIPADILGSVYENYLGYKLAQSEKGVEVSKDARKRKEQGIYYTPTYIVDYIVTNTLKPVLDKCETVADLKAIKVLDPACGSGSFLIRAVEMIYSKYLEFGAKPGEMTKITILLDNIFGVDLDEQAVEIARLNLLITILDSRGLLPDLSKNIKNGNSLISGTDAELEKAFGKNYRDRKPFNWAEKFSGVFNRDNPGFDVIIGNPPYVDSESMVKNNPDERTYIANRYLSAKGNWDLYIPFWELAYTLLRSGGIASFITPNKWLSIKYGEALRKMLLSDLKLLMNCGDVKIFDAGNSPIVVFVQKGFDSKVVLLDSLSDDLSFNERRTSVKSSLSDRSGWGILLSQDSQMIDKISADWPMVGDTFVLENPFTVSEAYEFVNILQDDKAKGSKKEFMHFVNTGTIDRYKLFWGTRQTKYIKHKYEYPVVDIKDFHSKFPKRYTQMQHCKLVISGMRHFESSLDDKGQVVAGKSTIIARENEDDLNKLKSLLAILNSRVIKFYLKEKFGSSGIDGGINFTASMVGSLPLPPIDELSNTLNEKVENMIRLNAELDKFEENTSKWAAVNDDIKKTDYQIDKLVYKLYNLTPEEIKIIEVST